MKFSFQKAKEQDQIRIFELYQSVIQSTFTTWDENYPSKALILEDIRNENLYILIDKDEIVAVGYLGKNENEDDNWAIHLNNPFGVARICVNPSYQGRGIGSYFMQKLIDEAKHRGADGMHFHVCTKNIAAMKMYEKVGFSNCGLGKSNYGFDFYKFEMKF